MDLLPPTPKQAATIRLSRDHFITILEGAVRTGKTVTSLEAWVAAVLTAPPGPLLMAGKTLDTLRRNVVDLLIEMVGEQNCRVTWGNGTMTLLGRTVHLVSANDERAESRIRGMTLAASYVDEASLVPEGWWQMLLTRHSLPRPRIIATTNPDTPRHWLMTNFLARACTTITQDGRVVKKARGALTVLRARYLLDDNPALSEEYKAAQRAAYTGLFFRRFILGEWVAAEGSIYPTFDPDGAHKATPADMQTEHWGSQWYIGVDVGTTNDTTAVLLVYNARTLRWVAASECRQTDANASFEKQARAIVTWIRGGFGGITRPLPPVGSLNPPGVTLRVIVDPAAKAFRNAWKELTGDWTWGAANDVIPGIARTAALFETNRITVNTDACKDLVDELAGYAWDPAATKRGQDAPLKVRDHGCDALRYSVMTACPTG